MQTRKGLSLSSFYLHLSHYKMRAFCSLQAKKNPSKCLQVKISRPGEMYPCISFMSKTLKTEDIHKLFSDESWNKLIRWVKCDRAEVVCQFTANSPAANSPLQVEVYCQFVSFRNLVKFIQPLLLMSCKITENMISLPAESQSTYIKSKMVFDNYKTCKQVGGKTSLFLT